jgi:ABC-type sugar transport system permease subunit
MGYASALAWLLFILAGVITFVQFRVSRKWVYYSGGVEK